MLLTNPFDLVGQVLAVPVKEQCDSMGIAGGIDLQRARKLAMRVCVPLWSYWAIGGVGHIVVDPRGLPLLLYRVRWLPSHLDRLLPPGLLRPLGVCQALHRLRRHALVIIPVNSVSSISLNLIIKKKKMGWIPVFDLVGLMAHQCRRVHML